MTDGPGWNPYDVLGVAAGATAEEIRRAFIRLAKELHPDLRPDDASATARFKRVTAAHALLSSIEKREQFDRGEIDADGRPLPRGAQAHARRAGAGFSADAWDGDFRAARRRPSASGRPRETRFVLEITLAEVATGGTRSIEGSGGQRFDVRIPPGIKDRETIQVRGAGIQGHNDDAGEAVVEVVILPDPMFRRDRDTILADIGISLAEAVAGATIALDTPAGRTDLTVPAGSNSGDRLRVRGKGIAGVGDLEVTLRIVLPDPLDAELTAFVRGWNARGATVARRLN